MMLHKIIPGIIIGIGDLIGLTKGFVVFNRVSKKALIYKNVREHDKN